MRCPDCDRSMEFIGVNEKGEKKYYCIYCHVVFVEKKSEK